MTPTPLLPAEPGSVLDHLKSAPFEFRFFQAVRLLTLAQRECPPVGLAADPAREPVRFAAHVSTAFPASELYDLVVPEAGARLPVPRMTVTFFGLHGPQGVMPPHYTEAMIDRDYAELGRKSLRDWFDLFNHRLTTLFYRAWERYRFAIPYERDRSAADPFRDALYALVGLGGTPVGKTTPLRGRLALRATGTPEAAPALARIPDEAMLYFGGFMARRTRGAHGLQVMLGLYFGLPVEVLSFQGQWLRLEPSEQTRLSQGLGNNQLGLNTVAGNRLWDVRSKIRVRIGPLDRTAFDELMPDRTPVPRAKTLFLVMQMVRLYIGAELDFDVQLVLRAEEVPACGPGARLGWNSWALSAPAARDADDAVFAGVEIHEVS